MKRGDLVWARWHWDGEYDDICLVLDVRSDVLGGSGAWQRRLPTGELETMVDLLPRCDELLVISVKDGSTSWISGTNVILIAEC